LNIGGFGPLFRFRGIGLDTVFETTGVLWLRGFLSEAELSALDQAAETGARAGQRIGLGDAVFGLIARSGWVARLSAQLGGAKPVRVVSFDKKAGANWGVPWHQDRVIAVKDRAEVEGFGNWSQKDGVWHCEPPLSVLSKMAFVRVHLDDATKENGAMSIAVGSHALGRVAASEAADRAAAFPIEYNTAKRGDVLVLNMLTLHKSDPSQSDAPRRVFRLDFAADPLPAPLEWA
jgi:hypothetical protein